MRAFRIQVGGHETSEMLFYADEFTACGCMQHYDE